MIHSKVKPLLPIDAHIPELIATLEAQNNVVLQAEPGAGKSTAVPLALLRSGKFAHGKIVMLEPRRVAAKSIAHYLAGLLGEKVGQTVGYHIRNDHKASKDTKLEIVTEGVLTRRIQQDPELSTISVIIFDEFHERSIHADLALMLALEVQEVYNEALKLLVMSATIDAEAVASYLNQAVVINCPGRSFPVAIEYSKQRSQYLPGQVTSAIQRTIAREKSGDILVFLPGQADITRCLVHAAENVDTNLECLPLYGALALEQQESVLKGGNGTQRRVIFATNIAETSLTIEGITTVIDAGREKVLSFDVKSGLSRLEVTNISKASAIQRAGRAGRLQAGHCIRLWSEAEHQRLADFQPEEVMVSELTNLVLELAAWGIHQYQDVNWLSKPPEPHYQAAIALNQSLGFLDEQQKITEHGLQALSLGLAPRLASMLINCSDEKEKSMACMLAALLSERDIFTANDSVNIVDRLLVLMEYLTDGKVTSLPRHAFRQKSLIDVGKLAHSFARKISSKLVLAHVGFHDIQLLAVPLLFHAYPDRLAKIRQQNNANYLLANGRGVTLKETDAMCEETWLLVCDCDGKNKDGLIYSAIPVLPSQIDALVSHKRKTNTVFEFDSGKQDIVGIETIQYQALIITQRKLDSITPAQFISCLSDVVQLQGLSVLNWHAKCERWLMRAQWLGAQIDEFPTINQAYLLDNLATWLLPYISDIRSIKQLQRIDIYDLLVATLDWQQQQFLDQHAPESYLTPSNKRVAIRYDQHQGPTVSVILQEMFGEIVSPMLANNKVPLRFELLSPARRPIQTTSDLQHFWRSSYFEVAKEMRGKYPKHRWPEKPLEETAGRSIKTKNT